MKYANRASVAARPHSDEPLPLLTWKDRSIVYAGMLAVAAVAWAYMIYMAWAMENMHLVEMWMPPRVAAGVWTLHDFLMLLLMWAVMMVAMMMPSVAPMVTVFASLNKRRKSRGRLYAETGAFVSGYLLAWFAFSVAATLVQWPLHTSSLLNPMMENSSYLFSGVVLAAAGAYQWTPLKTACLDYCRSPLGFLLSCWKDGAPGALGMGLRHGAFCVGCCWALMAVLFAVGVMNVLWMIALAVLVLVEKIIPPGIAVRIITGIVLSGWGLYWLFLYFAEG